MRQIVSNKLKVGGGLYTNGWAGGWVGTHATHTSSPCVNTCMYYALLCVYVLVHTFLHVYTCGHVSRVFICWYNSPHCQSQCTSTACKRKVKYKLNCSQCIKINNAHGLCDTICTRSVKYTLNCCQHSKINNIVCLCDTETTAQLTIMCQLPGQRLKQQQCMLTGHAV